MGKIIKRAIISGGGTGGHIFPAIAIADEIKRRNPNAEILFVGAKGKMEMEKVPDAGYEIKGLKIAGFQRRLTLSNFLLPFKIIQSMMKARRIIKEFDPNVVIGVGGYASGPTLKAATMLGIPCLIQEQNSFPGKTNKLLAKKVDKICVAYEGLERFFPKDKIVITGNPVRKEMVNIEGKRDEAIKYYEFDPSKKTILIIGGSLGARTLNQSMAAYLDKIPEDIQILWQCGKLYHDNLTVEYGTKIPERVKMVQFITRMDLAYAVADIVVSRAGAISVSELCIVKKATILVPSPNVAEDHQTKNAMALVDKGAAILIKDSNAKDNLLPMAFDVIYNQSKREFMSKSIAALAKPDATVDIVDAVVSILK